MDENIKVKAEMDRAKGESYKRAWENIIEPFFNKKQAELYQAFVDAGTSNTDGLLTIKMQSNALLMLHDEVQHYINTGTLAQKALEEEESNGN